MVTQHYQHVQTRWIVQVCLSGTPDIRNDQHTPFVACLTRLYQNPEHSFTELYCRYDIHQPSLHSKSNCLET